ncbi:MAG TPA: peptide ABC transporter substrate-binding protein, partial [Candidatus Rokubacteria bacterium]|nr:peptide ABC transporter substrate-binding protein [Candidatus Rokubacteria bacterium]
FTFPYDPGKARQLLQKAGYSAANPLKLAVMTTRGARAKDFEVVSAIAQMWKDVGIEAELEIITIPQFFQHRSAKTIAPLALYFWSNSTGDPVNSVGFMTRNKGPFKVWESPDVDPKVDPIFMETDERKRIAAAKEAARYVVERGYIIPLYQVVMPIIMKKDLMYDPYPQGLVLPQDMSWT